MNSIVARAIIEDNARRILVVRFIRRTDGRERRMVCIYFPEQAAKALYGFNPVERGLQPVWDVEAGAPRFVNLDGVESIKAGGRELHRYYEDEDECQEMEELLEEVEPFGDCDPSPGTLAEMDADMDELFSNQPYLS